MASLARKTNRKRISLAIPVSVMPLSAAWESPTGQNRSVGDPYGNRLYYGVVTVEPVTSNSPPDYCI